MVVSPHDGHGERGWGGSDVAGKVGGGVLMQIGEVADRTGLSLRTIRHYDDCGLVVPSHRSPGGFRLYTEDDVDRLSVVMRMKPLGFALDEMREFLDVLDRLDAVAEPRLSPGRGELLTLVAGYLATSRDRIRKLRRDLAYAEKFALMLEERLEHEGGT